MQTCHGVRAVLAHHHGLVLLCPEIQLLIQAVAGGVHIAGKVVPAVVAVDADDIHGAGGDIPGIVVLAADEGDRAVLRVQLMRQLIQRVPVIVGILREMLQIRFVAKAPQHHAGVVFVPMDHLGKHLPVMLRKGVFLVRIHRRPAADAHRRGLVHDQNALPVAQVVEFLGVGVVAGAHGIGVCPVDQVHILHVQYRVKAAAVGGKVLVLAKALEVKRLAVQKHLCAPHLNAAHAKGLVVDVRPAGDVQGVQVGCAGSGLPEMHLRDGDRAFCTLGACNGVAVRIQHRDMDKRATGGFDRVLHRAVHGGHYGHILDILFWGGVEHHRAVDARIVEKVKVRAVLRCGGALGGFHAGDARVVRAKEGQLSVLVAHRQGAVVHPVVAGDGQQRSLAGMQQVGDIRFKGRKAALVLRNELAVQPDFCGVGHRAKLQHHPLPGAEGGQCNAALIPRPAVVAAQGGGLVVLVVVAGGHGDGLGIRQGLCGVELVFLAAAQRKLPCAVQTQLQACFILFRI